MASHLPWLGIDVDLPNHRKSIRLGHALKDQNAWAYVAKVWFWCAKSCQEGQLEPEGAADTIETAAGWKGPRGKLFKAMVAIGWLDQSENGAVEIHDWEEHAGAHLDRLLADAERNRLNRAKRKAAKLLNSEPTVQRTHRGRPSDVQREIEIETKALKPDTGDPDLRSSNPPTPHPPRRRNGAHALAPDPEPAGGQGGVEEKPRVPLRVVPPPPAPEPEPPPPDPEPVVPALSPAAELWGRVLQRIEDDGKRYAITWLERLGDPRLEDRTLTVGGENEFFVAWVLDHYRELLSEAVAAEGFAEIRVDVSANVGLPVPAPRPPRMTGTEWLAAKNRLRRDPEYQVAPEPDVPPEFSAWYAKRESEGIGGEELLLAYERWLLDRDPAKFGWVRHGWPLETFMKKKVWSSRLRA